MKYVVIGLGNPGEKYKLTRHNAGRIILSRIAGEDFSDLAMEPWQEKKSWGVKIAEGRSVAGRFQFILPETYMNLSGRALKKIPEIKELDNLVILHDDLALPLGQWRFSLGRGSGGHNGVESIIRALGTKDFFRLRIGIGRTQSVSDTGWWKKIFSGRPSSKDYVLGKFTAAELNTLIHLAPKIKEALILAMSQGRQAAMNKFN